MTTQSLITRRLRSRALLFFCAVLGVARGPRALSGVLLARLALGLFLSLEHLADGAVRGRHLHAQKGRGLVTEAI